MTPEPSFIEPRWPGRAVRGSRRGCCRGAAWKTNSLERYDVTPQRDCYRYGSQEPSQQVRDSGIRGRLDRACVLAVFRFEVSPPHQRLDFHGIYLDPTPLPAHAAVGGSRSAGDWGGLVGWLGTVVMVPRHRRCGRLYRLCSFLGSAIKLGDR